MKKQITLILFLLICLFCFNIKIDAETNDNLVNIYFFHSDSCSHCKEENIFLEEISENFSNVRIYKYEIHNESTSEVLKKAASIYSINTKGVPITIIGNKVYTGFSQEKSSLKFIKTIEYYSRYSYQDKLGEYLEVELPTYAIEENDITLEKFIDTYHNYNLLGLKTDNLNTSTISLILGLLSSINIIRLIVLIFVLLIINTLKQEKTKILLTMSYILLEILFLTVFLINSTILNYIFLSMILILFIITINKIRKNKKDYLPFIIIIVATIIGNYIANTFDQNIAIFQNLLDLYFLNGFNKIIYYNNYIISSLTVTMIIIYVGDLLLGKIKKNLIQKKSYTKI